MCACIGDFLLIKCEPQKSPLSVQFEVLVLSMIILYLKFMLKELALLLQEQDLKRRGDLLQKDQLSVMEAQDKELAKVLQEQVRYFLFIYYFIFLSQFLLWKDCVVYKGSPFSVNQITYLYFKILYWFWKYKYLR